jgi:hypothetical protein
VSFSVDFVAPEQFSHKRWWRPDRPGAAWFYHTPAPVRPPSYLRDYSTVDPQIRRIVMWLHSKGMPTLPSCAGHWPDKKWARRCFAALVEDACKIRYGGIYMIDVETGQRALLQDPYWEMPWGDWSHFHSDMREYDGQGYVCFALDPSHLVWRYLPELQGLLGVSARGLRHRGIPCLEIRVRTADAISQSNAWHSVECFLRRLG